MTSFYERKIALELLDLEPEERAEALARFIRNTCNKLDISFSELNQELDRQDRLSAFDRR